MLDEGREVESECFHHTRSEGLSASISSFRQGPKQCVCVCVSEWLCLCVRDSLCVSFMEYILLTVVWLKFLSVRAQPPLSALCLP